MIRKTLVERILLEAEDTEHALQRFKQRFTQNLLTVGYEISPAIYMPVGTYNLPDNIKAVISETIELILNFNFPKKKDYGVKIVDVIIDKNKVEYISESKKEECINEKLVFLAEGSNGNSVYAIIRENKYKTIYYAKNYIPQTKEKLRVDVMINDLKKSIEKKSIY